MTFIKHFIKNSPFLGRIFKVFLNFYYLTKFCDQATLEGKMTVLEIFFDISAKGCFLCLVHFVHWINMVFLFFSICIIRCWLLNNYKLRLHRRSIYKNTVEKSYRKSATQTQDSKIIKWELEPIKWDLQVWS